jgi:hypothetical protein
MYTVRPGTVSKEAGLLLSKTKPSHSNQQQPEALPDQAKMGPELQATYPTPRPNWLPNNTRPPIKSLPDIIYNTV